MATRLKNVLLPKPVVIDRMQGVINGTGGAAADKDRVGYLTRERAADTIDLMKMAFTNPLTDEDMAEGVARADLKKGVTTATGLTYYDLRAPALNLFPTVTPLRNSVPRMQRQYPGDAAHWKAVDSTVGSGFPYMGWVPEGQRSASMSYMTSNHSLTYMTIGEEDSLTEEARFAAMGFEDEDALVQLRLLLKMFVKEEAAILGGNNSLVLTQPGAITATNTGSGNALANGTYDVWCVALTVEGFLNTSLANGVATTLLIQGNDGQTYTLNGGSSNKNVSAAAVTTTGTQGISASVGAVAGAAGYAWFIGLTGAATLQAITTINSVFFGAAIATGRQSIGAVTADHSNNPSVAYDGIMTTLYKASGSYLKVFATGTAGTGTGFTSSGAGSVIEVDTMFKSTWDINRLSPTVGYVNSQELKNLTYLVLNGSSAPLLRYNTEATDAGIPEYKITAAGVVAFYFNPYTPDGGVKVPIKVHPNIAPGTCLFWAEHLPPWYVSNQTPEVAVVQTRQDYYAEVWPKVSRSQFYGVYCQAVFAMYATFAGAILTNIGDTH